MREEINQQSTESRERISQLSSQSKEFQAVIKSLQSENEVLGNEGRKLKEVQREFT